MSVSSCFMFCRCRTGSTALIRAVADHARAAAFAEILNGTQPHCYQSYLVDRLSNDAEAKISFLNEGPLFAFRGYIGDQIGRARQRKSELEFTLFESKIENLYCLSDPWSHPGGGFSNLGFLDRVVAAFDSIIFLRRRNVWDRYCSDISSRATGIYHSDEGDPNAVPIVKTSVSVDSLVDTLISEIDFDQRFFDYLSRKSPNVWVINYEDIFADGKFTPEFSKQFSEHFNGIELPPPNMGKLARPSGRNLVENYDEAIAAIRNAPALAWMLEA
jgi:hypothetical protein